MGCRTPGWIWEWAANRGEFKKKSPALTGRKRHGTSQFQTHCGSNFVGERFDNTSPPQEDILTRLASERCGVQTPESIICMAPELPLDVNYSGEGVCSLLAQSFFNRQPVSAHNFTAAPAKATSRISLGCTWDGCEFSFPSPEDLTNHLIEHSQDVLARWVRHSGCIWKGCKSKAIFKTTWHTNIILGTFIRIRLYATHQGAHTRRHSETTRISTVTIGRRI